MTSPVLVAYRTENIFGHTCTIYTPSVIAISLIEVELWRVERPPHQHLPAAEDYKKPGLHCR